MTDGNFSHERCNFVAEKFYRMEGLGMEKRAGTHLHVQAGNSSEHFVKVVDFFGNGFGIADNQCSGGTEQSIEVARRTGGQPRSLPISVNMRA